MKFQFLIFIVLFTISGIFAQTTRFVSTTGSDSNSGLSSNSAFATINKAIAASACGDSIYVMGGTYHEKIIAYQVCPETDRIVIQGDVADRPLIIGDSMAANKYAISAGGQGFVFRHLELTSPYPDICSQSNMVVVGSGDDMIFIDNIIRNSGYDGMKTTSDCSTSTWANDWQVIDCEIINNGLGCPSSIQNGDGIDFTECHNCLIEGTTIKDNMGHQVQIKLEARNVTVENCRIEGKYLFQIGINGVTPQCDPNELNADSVFIRHNIIIAKGDTSEFVFKLSDVSNLFIENNTIIKDTITHANVGFICFGGCAGGTSWEQTPTAPVVIRNNIFANMSNVLFYDGPVSTFFDPFDIAAANVIANYNLFYDSNGEYTTPVDGGAASIVADPLFCNYPKSFELQSSSPCIGSGDSQSPNDPNNTRNDIGAKYYHLPCVPNELISPSFNNTITVSPNPFSSSTTIQTEKYLVNATLTIYNSLGQKVKVINNISGSTCTLTRDNLPVGYYFLSISENNETISGEYLILSD